MLKNKLYYLRSKLARLRISGLTLAEISSHSLPVLRYYLRVLSVVAVLQIVFMFSLILHGFILTTFPTFFSSHWVNFLLTETLHEYDCFRRHLAEYLCNEPSGNVELLEELLLHVDQAAIAAENMQQQLSFLDVAVGELKWYAVWWVARRAIRWIVLVVLVWWVIYSVRRKLTPTHTVENNCLVDPQVSELIQHYRWWTIRIQGWLLTWMWLTFFRLFFIQTPFLYGHYAVGLDFSQTYLAELEQIITCWVDKSTTWDKPYWCDLLLDIHQLQQYNSHLYSYYNSSAKFFPHPRQALFMLLVIYSPLWGMIGWAVSDFYLVRRTCTISSPPRDVV